MVAMATAAHARSDRFSSWPTPGPERGFTLIELMTVLTIVAVFAMLAGPAFSELAASQRVQTAAEDIFSSLLRTRSEAIKQNTDVSMTAPGSPAAWTSGWTVATGGSNVYVHAALPNLAIAGPSGAVTYRSSGRISGTTVPKFSISASHTNTVRCVQVNLSGEPVVTRSACS